MSIRVRVITIEGESADVAGAITAVTAAFAPTAGLAVPALPAPRAENGGRSVGRSVGTKRVPRRASPERRATGESDEAILQALRFRPLRVAELADALHSDKRKVPNAIQRLYSKLTRLVRDGQLKRVGKTYAVKASNS